MQELITKYLCNETSPEENNSLLIWVNESDENKQLFSETSLAWNYLHAKQSQVKFNSEKAFTTFKSKTGLNTKSFPLWKKLASVAAIFLIALTVVTLYVTQKPETITFANANSNVNTITLPDGSLVYVDSGSSISYPEEFSNNTREITTTGHVYCSVKPNAEKPFIVHTSNFDVKVLGTEFDIIEDNKTSTIIVAEGKVNVYNGTNSFNIIKNECVQFSNGVLEKNLNKDVNFLSWKTGVLTFSSTPLESVISDLERHYNCTFKIENKAIYTERLDGTFKDLKIEEVIEILSNTFDFSFILSNNTITVK